MDFKNYRAELVDSIAGLIGARGKSPGFTVQPTLNPTIDVAAISATPFSGIGRPVMSFRPVTAVAAENGHVWISPGLNLAIEPLEIRIVGPATLYQVVLLSQVQQAAIGVTNFSRFSLVRQRVPGPADGLWPDLSPSVVSFGTIVGITGTPVARFNAFPAINGDTVIDLRGLGIALYGADPGTQNIQGFGIACETVNTAFDVSVIAREWPRP